MVVDLYCSGIVYSSMSAMLVHILWCFPVLFHTYSASYDSIPSSLKIPSAFNGGAAGYDDQNDIILMFGGYDSPRQFIQFQNNEFIYLNTSYLPANEAAAGQSNYFQLNHTLWILNQQGTHFITIDTHSPYTVTIPNITIPILVDNNGCLAMTPTHILIVGGATAKDCDAHEFVQIYDIKNEQWLSGVPLLPEKRMNVACSVVNDTLYAIGGSSGGTNCEKSLDSIVSLNVSEAAFISNISSQQWQLVPGATLTKASGAVAIAKHESDLILIGGSDKDSKDLKDVHIFDTITGDCYLAGSLDTAVSLTVAMIHEISNTLFIFGGSPNSDLWQYIDLPTEAPTADPTNVPTQNPTFIPSSPPTSDPTVDPTLQPINTFDPTIAPTYDPTANPTANPTLFPTFKPTFVPTLIPTTSHPTIKVAVDIPISSSPTIADTISYTKSTVGVISDTEIKERDSTSDEKALDNLAIILIVLCGSLCFIILITLAVGGYSFKRKRKESVSKQTHMLNNTVNAATAPKTSMVTVASDPNAVIGEKDESVTVSDVINVVHITRKNTTLTTDAAQEDREKEHEGDNDVELAEVDDDSSSNESLFDDDHQTRGALGPQSMQNAINFMNNA